MNNDYRTIISIDAGFDLDPLRPLITYSERISNARCADSHKHPRGQLLYCDSGVMKVEVPNQLWVVAALHAIWIPPDVAHQVYFPRDVQVSSAFIEAKVSKGLPASSFAFEIDNFCRSLLSKIVSFNNQHPLSLPQQRIVEVFLDEMTSIRPASTFLPLSDHPAIKKITAEIQNRWQHTDPVSYYADLCCISPRTLSRLFMQELGMSFTDWCVRLKLLEAMRLLGENRSVKEIAFELGYQNTSSFIYTFKKHFGKTPGNKNKNTAIIN